MVPYFERDCYTGTFPLGFVEGCDGNQTHCLNHFVFVLYIGTATRVVASYQADQNPSDLSNLKETIWQSMMKQHVSGVAIF
jgi:hypothetical protein